MRLLLPAEKLGGAPVVQEPATENGYATEAILHPRRRGIGSVLGFHILCLDGPTIWEPEERFTKETVTNHFRRQARRHRAALASVVVGRTTVAFRVNGSRGALKPRGLVLQVKGDAGLLPRHENTSLAVAWYFPGTRDSTAHLLALDLISQCRVACTVGHWGRCCSTQHLRKTPSHAGVRARDGTHPEGGPSYPHLK